MKKIPKSLKMFERFGVDFVAEAGDGIEFIADSPFSGRKRKLYVNADMLQWKCQHTGKSGNEYGWLEAMHEMYKENTDDSDRKILAKDRGVTVAAIRRWDIVIDPDGEYLIPVRNVNGTITDLRRYTLGGRVMSTPGRSLGLLGAHLLAKYPDWLVVICEGEFDAIAMDCMFRLAKMKVIVLGVPGASVWKKDWAAMLSGRDVVMVYDNDQPGEDGLAKSIVEVAKQAKRVRWADWPTDFDSGYDGRDFAADAIRKRRVGCVAAVEYFMSDSLLKTDHLAIEDAEDAPAVRRFKGRAPRFTDIIAEFGKFFEMDRDTIDAMALMLAVSVSTVMSGDPVWLFIVGPPGCGKTSIMGSMHDDPLTVFRSSVTSKSLVSGWAGAEDPSLLAKVDNRTLCIKDFTEILTLQFAERADIYSILRGAYDGSVERSYANGVAREYQVHFSIVACVTSKIYGEDDGSLGERFLKFHMFKGSMLDYMGRVGRITDTIISTMGTEKKRDDTVGPKVSHFLDSARKRTAKMSNADFRSYLTDTVIVKIQALAHLTSLLRTTVERIPHIDSVKYKPQPEISGRLLKQLIKLGISLAVVMGKKSIDNSILGILQRVAMDSAVSWHLDIFRAMMARGGPMVRKEIGEFTGMSSSNLQRTLEDMTYIRLVNKRAPMADELEGVEADTLRGRPAMVFELSPILVGLWEKADMQLDLSDLPPREGLPAGGPWKSRKSAGKTKSNSPKVRVRRKKKKGSVGRD